MTEALSGGLLAARLSRAPVLGETVEVLGTGTPVVELAHRSDNPHSDLLVRISEVAHRFSAGSRIRLLVAGGSFPHWERNLGTDEHPGTGTAMAASHRTIDLTASRIRLPVRP